MKKIYILFIGLFVHLSANSQDLYLINENLTINSSDVNATNLATETYLVNNSGQVIDVTYTINDGNLVTYNWPTAAVGICNDATCDDPSIKVNGNFSMGIGDSVNIKITVLPEGIADSIGGTIKFSVPGTQVNRVTGNYSIKVGNTTTGIKDLDTKSLNIFPNPATNFIQINGIDNISQIEKVEVYNIIGRKVYSKQVNTSSDLNVNVQNYESGVYLVKLFNASTNLFYTKTFVKN